MRGKLESADGSHAELQTLMPMNAINTNTSVQALPTAFAVYTEFPFQFLRLFAYSFGCLHPTEFWNLEP